MKIRVGLVAATALTTLFLAGCASSSDDDSEGPTTEPTTTSANHGQTRTTSPDATPQGFSASTSESFSRQTPETLSFSETCLELSDGGDESLLYRIPAHAKEMNETATLDYGHYTVAIGITSDLEEIADLAPAQMEPTLTSLAMTHQDLVDAAKSNEDSFGFDPRVAYTAATGAASACLDGEDKDAFADHIYELVVDAPRN